MMVGLLGQRSSATNLLIDYHEFFVAPRNVDEAKASAPLVREHVRETHPENCMSSLLDIENESDDGLAFSASEIEGDSDQVRLILVKSLL